MTTRFECPFCEAYSHFKIIQGGGPAPASREREGQDLVFVAVQCQNEQCRRVIGAEAPAAQGTSSPNSQGEIYDWWPKKVSGKKFNDVPPHISDAADEAYRCLSIGAYRGAIALARAVVEATAKDKGATGYNLSAKIDSLEENGIISTAMKDAAHEIRFAGNDSAHGDLAAAQYTEDDAEEVLALMGSILARVYQEPAQVARVRRRRQERKEGPAPE